MRFASSFGHSLDAMAPFDEVRHIESHVGLLTSTLVCGVVVDDFIHFRQG
jgi:hypothetical protein